ncbi:hypothetical protein [Hoeflea marina]|uniref:hypothetical protein n=1 Tax=Hoeflea marina TaxID=274592 RepID=UPI0011B58158|nr:hypothetical protein [Hoeflea marina]
MKRDAADARGNNDIDIEVVERQTEKGVWSVEVIDHTDGGAIYLTKFHGACSRARATQYAEWLRT